MASVKEHKDGANLIIDQAGFSFLVFRDPDNFDVQKVQHHDAVLIESSSEDYSRLVLKRIRSSMMPEIFLTPIFLLNDGLEANSNLPKMVNGEVQSLRELNLIIPSLEKILGNIKAISLPNTTSFEAQIISKMIALMYTQEKKILEPIPDIYADLNYYFPFLSENFNRSEEKSILAILELAENDGMLRSEYMDRVYTCTDCSSSKLSYREVCPKCSSSNTKPDDIIHHFPCGYVGPQKDFSNEIDDQMDCPKCNKRLRHIGVDYDKPSVIHECFNCNHRFQDYFVNAKCMSCSNDQSVENLNAVEIKQYRLTRKGELAAVKGYVATSRQIEEVIGTIKYETFQTMLKYEIERLKQSLGDSNLCAIHIANSSEVYSKLGGDVQRGLLKDLVSVIRSNIRTSDIIAFESSELIILSMNDIPAKIAERIMGEIITLLNDLIKNSFEQVEVDFQTRVLPVDYKKTHEAQLRELISTFQ